MPRKNEKGLILNKKAVFDAARSIAASSEMPTIKDIRAQLGGGGSETTIHKYLSLWKKGLLKTAAKMEDYSDINQEKITAWLDQKDVLEQVPTSQTTHIYMHAEDKVRHQEVQKNRYVGSTLYKGRRQI